MKAPIIAYETRLAMKMYPYTFWTKRIKLLIAILKFKQAIRKTYDNKDYIYNKLCN